MLSLSCGWDIKTEARVASWSLLGTVPAGDHQLLGTTFGYRDRSVTSFFGCHATFTWKSFVTVWRKVTDSDLVPNFWSPLWGKPRWVVYENFDLIRNSKKFLQRCKESFEADLGCYEITIHTIVCWSLTLVLIKLSLGEFLGGSSIFCHLLRTGDPWEPRNWLRRRDGERLNPKDEEDPARVLLNPGRERRGESEGIPFGTRGGRRGLWTGFWTASNNQYVVTFPFPW